MIVAGLKKDLRRNAPSLPLSFVEEPVQIEYEEVRDNHPAWPSVEMRSNDPPKAVATALGLPAVKYLECSARTGEGVTEFFNFVMDAAVSKKLEQRKMMEKARTGGLIQRGAKHLEDGLKKAGNDIANLARKKDE